MQKIRKCPGCGEIDPPLTLYLKEPEKYQNLTSIPDNRTYELICLACNETVEIFIVDNTIKAAASLREEMDKLYGKPTIYP